jgi:nucleotide-binding universal stress UspA family protein
MQEGSMPFKTIVAIVQSEQDAERVLDGAIALASRFQAHVIGVHAEALPMPYTSATGFPDTEFMQVSADLNKERSAKLRTIFQKKLQPSGLSFEWRAEETFSGDSALSSLAIVRAADIVVAAQRDADSDTNADIGSLVYDAGRPVLVVPHAGPIAASFRHVMLAWNGSREAARAAFDALPFMIEAEKVEIFVVDPGEDSDEEGLGGAGIAAALTRHGVKASVATRQAKGGTIEDAVQNRLIETGADLIVLGAYSHSWLHRLLYGGVTRTVLRSSPVTAFLSR